MQNISVALENLRNGTLRATVRHCGRTVAQRECVQGEEREALNAVMKIGCFAHVVNGAYDMTNIRLNDAAKAILA